MASGASKRKQKKLVALAKRLETCIASPLELELERKLIAFALASNQHALTPLSASTLVDTLERAEAVRVLLAADYTMKLMESRARRDRLGHHELVGRRDDHGNALGGFRQCAERIATTPRLAFAAGYALNLTDAAATHFTELVFRRK